MGGWWLPADAIKPGAVAYLGGAGDDITFDLALLAKGCVVRTFDPTPISIAHIESLEITDDRFRFVPVGWWNAEAEVQFFEARDKRYPENLSVVNLQRTHSSISAPVKSISDHMRDLGHTQIDICKIDIEGAEYEVLDSMIEDRILPRHLLVEFDQPMPPRKTLRYIRRLKNLDYRLAKVDFFNYTFIREAASSSPGGARL